METNVVITAFALTMLAGLSTGIGALISLLCKQQNTKFLCVSLGFSAGVMIYVSFMEIFPQAIQSLSGMNGSSGNWIAIISFFGGMLFVGLIDKFIPEDINPHELGQRECLSGQPEQVCTEVSAQNGNAKLKRTGVMTALAIGIHNFPEGIATFMAAVTDPALGLAIAAAIAIHNIPEGVAVAVPIYYATGSRKKAILYSALSGLAEPIGALVGFLILMPFFSPVTFGIMFAGVAGIMVFISLDELLPAAEEYGEHHLCIYGLVAGMAVMAASLLLL